MDRNCYLIYITLSLLICSCAAHKEFSSLPDVSAKDFVQPASDKTPAVGLYTLSNHQGMKVSITNYGARIVSLFAPNRNGKCEDLVCGFSNLNDYLTHKQNFGATVGRYIGRILNARMTIDSITYHLESNGGKHCSHGGSPGFAERIWTVRHRNDRQLQLEYISPDGENGFPGELTLDVTFTLTNKNVLKIDYHATTDKATVLNPSNHSFFNISGNLRQSIEPLFLQADGDSITEYDPMKCVTGRFLSVKGTPFDFLNPHRIGDRINEDNAQLNVTRGYDHAWRLNHPGDIRHRAAILSDSISGRTLEVYTTEPGLHIYTANGLKEKLIGKGGIAYPHRSAICFETTHFADSPNKPQFPSTLLRPGQTFHSQTRFKFGVIK